MNTAVSAFLSRHNFVHHEDVNTIAESILDDMNRGLRGQESDQDMIPTWCLPPEQKACGKSVIVIDAGGTNFRSCLVTFDEAGAAAISDLEKTKMPGVERELDRKEFFDCFAKNLEHVKDRADSIGFCFSYPMQITDDGDGILLGFSKEVKAPEVVGCHIGKCLKEALVAHGWKEPRRITMLNDTVAALLAGAAAPTAGNQYSSYIGLILGTGLNAAYIQPAVPERERFPRQIVVCESGKTRAVSRSDFDVALDTKTVKPGTFYMEKLCSGAYLGPQSLEMIHAAASEGLFSVEFAKKLLELDALTLIDMDGFLHGPYNDKYQLGAIAAESATAEDYDRLYQMLDAVVERSARHAAAILVAAVVQGGEGRNAARPVCILCNGTTFFKTHKIKERVHGYLDDELTRRRGLHWEIIARDNDITLGTAIAGLIER
ncbi:MAG: hexokinase [Treponemataceae bacterium]|nr:hexokinase [Treponemataceae bacterium]